MVEFLVGGLVAEDAGPRRRRRRLWEPRARASSLPARRRRQSGLSCPFRVLGVNSARRWRRTGTGVFELQHDPMRWAAALLLPEPAAFWTGRRTFFKTGTGALVLGRAPMDCFQTVCHPWGNPSQVQRKGNEMKPGHGCRSTEGRPGYKGRRGMRRRRPPARSGRLGCGRQPSEEKDRCGARDFPHVVPFGAGFCQCPGQGQSRQQQ
jgi:hypothetical protein